MGRTQFSASEIRTTRIYLHKRRHVVDSCQIWNDGVFRLQPLYTRKESMTTLPMLDQTPIIIRHRGQKSSAHRHQCSRPESRIIQQHHTPSEMVIHQILHRLHGQHGDETHTRRSPKRQSPGKLVHSTSEQDSL